jgi:hypothetical protein
MSDTDAPVDDPDDGGHRPSIPPRDDRADDHAGTEARDRPVGDFGTADQADPGGDSDTDASPADGGS